jgi:hypothetical protein
MILISVLFTVTTVSAGQLLCAGLFRLVVLDFEAGGPGQSASPPPSRRGMCISHRNSIFHAQLLLYPFQSKCVLKLVCVDRVVPLLER